MVVKTRSQAGVKLRAPKRFIDEAPSAPQPAAPKPRTAARPKAAPKARAPLTKSTATATAPRGPGRPRSTTNAGVKKSKGKKATITRKKSTNTAKTTTKSTASTTRKPAPRLSNARRTRNYRSPPSPSSSSSSSSSPPSSPSSPSSSSPSETHSARGTTPPLKSIHRHDPTTGSSTISASGSPQARNIKARNIKARAASASPLQRKRAATTRPRTRGKRPRSA
ncbi:MAG: hypothetical protein HETSPECPRED_003774 [Heterodermia speciosa]|uniref:Uncharacterized protein n=1 Tax=Heterodermia speciosa TaxID=116794 RepID=A0A8H3ILY4_9LECA|nr:MAG: hypothetical protein HETSPECPRED_003774 [Heterodermia speciosa]